MRDKFKDEDDPVQWKVGDEFAPFHPSASHVTPDYRDGWNACYHAAARLAEPDAELQERLRAMCETLRRTPKPLAEIIPLLQQAADALAARQVR